MAEALNLNRKEQILSVSSKLFREKGFATATMRDVANVLGIEAASIYHHFKSKEEILELICFGMAEKFLTAMKEVNDIYFNAAEKLQMAVRAHVAIITANPDQSAVFLNDWKSLPEPKLSAFHNIRHAYESEFRLIVKHGKEEDIFSDVDEKFAALIILSAVNWIYQWYSPQGKMKPEEIADHLSAFILSGLRKKLVTDLHYKP